VTGPADSSPRYRLERRSKTCGLPLEGSIFRMVALEMADGQLALADRWLLVADGRAQLPHDRRRPPLVAALEHMRSGCGWLVSAAVHT